MDTLAKLFALAACTLVASCASMQGTIWRGELKCSARNNLPAFTMPLNVRVDHNEFVLDGGAMPGKPGYAQLRGFPDPDDRLDLTGEVSPSGTDRLKTQLQGRRDGTGYTLAGNAGRQGCTLAMRPQ